MKNLSIVLPVHNESEGIETSIKKIVDVLAKTSITYEILCIENGSTDDSLSILRNIAKKNIELRVYQSDKGWGNAVQKGISVAQSMYLCYMVSDGQVDPLIIPKLYNLIESGEYGLVKISRSSRENMKRFLNSRAYNMLAYIIFNLPTYDVNGTPKMLLTATAKKMKLQSHNIAIDLELMIKLKMNNLSFKEVAVPSYARESGTSTTNIKSVIEMLKNMKKFFLQKNSWKDLI